MKWNNTESKQLHPSPEEETEMAHFILLTNLTTDGVKTMKNNPARITEVNAEMEQIGLKVLHQWATLGTYDFISVVEAPDAETMARASVELASRGTTTNCTLTAIPAKEFAAGL